MEFLWDPLVWMVPVFCLALCYVTGDLVQMIFQTNRGIAVKVLSGFVVLLCVFHLISLPFMFNGQPFSLLYRIFLIVLAAIIIAYIVFSVIRKRLPLFEDAKRLLNTIIDIAKKRWWMFLVWIIVAIFIIWHIETVILHVAYNVDDNFYVSQSLMILTRDRLPDVLPSCGIAGSQFPPTYLLVSWEALLSFLSKLFVTSPAVLCHSVIPALLLPLHYMAYYLVGRELCGKRAGIFLIFVGLLNIACGPNTYNQGAFLTLRIWQGKAVLVNLLLPLLLYVFLRIVKTKKLPVRHLLFLFGILLASQAATTVGTYLAPVLYAVYAVTTLIITRKWKLFAKLLIPAAAITPFVLWKLFLLLNAGTLSSLSEGTGVYDKSFSEMFLNYFGFSLIPVFFLLALVIFAVVLRKGTKKPLRFFFLLTSGILIVFFINPFTMPYVERFVTGVGVYWRMFWLLQITPVIAAGFTLLLSIPKQKLLRTALCLFLAIALCVSGRSILLDEDYKEEFNDPSKISATSRHIAQTIHEQVYLDNPQAAPEEQAEIAQQTLLMMPRTLSLELRQYADISLAYYAYYSNNYMAYMSDEDFEVLQELYDILYRQKTWTAKELDAIIKQLQIDYVAIGTGTAQENARNMPKAFEEVYKGSRYTLFKTNASPVN